MRRGTVLFSTLVFALFAVADGTFADLAAKDDLQINTKESGNETNPAVAGLASRGFVVTWAASPGLDGSGSGVFARRYDAKSKPIGIEFQVNTSTKDDQWDPSIAALRDGGFVIVWSTLHDEDSLTEIYAQRYNSKGKPKGKEFRVNTKKDKNQNAPSVAGLAKGGFVVAWNTTAKDGEFDVHAQLFSKKGKKKGKEFRVNSYKKSFQALASVAGLSGGGFIIVWESEGQDGDSAGIYGQRYNAGAKPKGKEFRVNKRTAGLQGSPVVAGLSSGGFVVSWDSEGADKSQAGVVARRYSASGKAKGGEFQVNTYWKLSQTDPALAALSRGGFVIAWVSEDQDEDPGFDLGGIYAQRYKSNGKPKGKEFGVPAFTTGRQRNPAIVGQTKSRSFLVTWESDGQNANGYNIYGQSVAK